MIKGTTPIHVFNIPLKASEIQNVEITYSQSDEVILQKGVADCIIEDDRITVKLTQEDTLKFNHKKKVQFQIRVLTVEGVAMSSRVMFMEAEQCLSNEELA